MSSVFIILLAVVLIFVILGIMVTFIYNQLVVLKNRFKNAFSQIDVQLRRRYDLIPNLVAAAKAYLSHESQTLEAVIEARAKATSAQISLNGDPTQISALHQLTAADGQLNSALGRLMMSMEAYPELKADKTISELREELSSTENRVAFARQAFNDAVTAYNTQRNSFPSVLLAGAFGHPQDAALLAFENREAIQTAPRVSF
jgi:LemA protein